MAAAGSRSAGPAGGFEAGEDETGGLEDLDQPQDPASNTAGRWRLQVGHAALNLP